MSFLACTIAGTSTGVAGITVYGGSGTQISGGGISGFTLGSGISVQQSQTPDIDDVNISNCKYGVLYEDSAAGTLSDSVIEDGTGTSSYGVRTDDSSCPALTDETTLDDHKYGLYCNDNSTPVMRDCLVSDCGYGCYTKATATPDLGTSGDHGGNSVTTTTAYNVYSPARYNTVYAEYNWWGTSSPPSGKFSGGVDYIPYLGSNPFSLYVLPTLLDRKLSLDQPMLSVGPNPASSSTAFRVANLESGLTGSVSVYDVQGRLVRSMPLQGGEATWDMSNASGRSVTPGIYLYRVVAGDYESTGRITVIR